MSDLIPQDNPGTNAQDDPQTPPAAMSQTTQTRPSSTDRRTTASSAVYVPQTFSAPTWMTLAAGVIIVAGISLGRDVLIPVALALLLSFLLAPLVSRLRRMGLPRVISVLLSVLLATAILFVIIMFMAKQIVDLAGNLPTYQGNIERKIESLRVSPNGTMDRVLRMVYRLDSKIKGDEAHDPDNTSENKDAPPPPPKEQAPASKLNPLEIVGTLLNTTLGPLTTAGMVFIFVFFILLEREDTRNKVIRFLGNRPGQMLHSTQAFDDAASRVSRYLLMQLIVNVTYGIPIGVGLYFIGVPNPVLWGVVACVLRFIPYVGPIVAALCPIALAFAVDPGWSMIVWTLLLYVVIEIISNNFIETLAYGTSTGISSVGILFSAVFWGWLWGPIGLLLSTPLTVCLVVLGEHIPSLRMFPMLLGDQPALPLYGVIYQRLLAMDLDEPDDLVHQYLDEHSLEEFYESVMLPLLNMIELEQTHSALEPARREFIMEHVRAILEDAAQEADEHGPVKANGKEKGKDKGKDKDKEKDKPQESTTQSVALSKTNAPALCLPAHDETDELVARMLTILLERQGVRAITLSSRMLSSERMDQIDELNPSVVCVSVLPPFGAFHARHSVRRIRERFPKLTIIVGYWSTDDAPSDFESRCKAAGAQLTVKTLKRAIEELKQEAMSQQTTCSLSTVDVNQPK